MCRSAAAGGRRCSGGNAHRTRALNAARKNVERARRGLNKARATEDPDAVQTAETQLAQAKQRLTDTHTAHPRTTTDEQDTPQTADDETTKDTMSTDDEQTTAGQNRDVTPPAAENPRVTNTTTIINHTGPISTGSDDQVNVFHNGRLVSSQTTPAGTALPPEVAEKIRKAEAAAEQAMRDIRERFAGIPTPAPGTVHVQGTTGRRITGSTEPLHVGTGKQFTQGPDGQFHETPGTAGEGGDTTPTAHHVTNTNYAAPGSHVGLQTAVSTGATVFMNSTTAPVTPEVAERVRRAADKARAARKRAKATAAADAAGAEHSDDAAAPDGRITVHNVAGRDEHVAFQIGIQLGDVHHHRH